MSRSIEDLEAEILLLKQQLKEKEKALEEANKLLNAMLNRGQDQQQDDQAPPAPTLPTAQYVQQGAIPRRLGAQAAAATQQSIHDLASAAGWMPQARNIYNFTNVNTVNMRVGSSSSAASPAVVVPQVLSTPAPAIPRPQQQIPGFVTTATMAATGPAVPTTIAPGPAASPNTPAPAGPAATDAHDAKKN